MLRGGASGLSHSPRHDRCGRPRTAERAPHHPGAMTDPEPPPAVTAGLRAALCDFIDAAGARRVLPTVFHVGRPGGRPGTHRLAVPEEPGLGPGLRADLVERALDGLDVADPCAWVTRSGPLAPTDHDFAWFSASREAFARHGLDLPGFFVITRAGWLNLMTEHALPHTGVRRRRRRRA